MRNILVSSFTAFLSGMCFKFGMSCVVISGICYIGYSLNPVCVKSGMCSVIAEGDSLALFTAQM